MLYLRVCTALFGYDATSSDEITFREGDILYVVDESEPEWWTAEHKDSKARGVIPSNYVQEVRQEFSGRDA